MSGPVGRAVAMELLPLPSSGLRSHRQPTTTRSSTWTRLAHVAGVSKYHSPRSFEAAYGETPIRHLTRRRIEQAQDLLRSANLGDHRDLRDRGLRQPRLVLRPIQRTSSASHHQRTAPAGRRRAVRTSPGATCSCGASGRSSNLPDADPLAVIDGRPRPRLRRSPRPSTSSARLRNRRRTVAACAAPGRSAPEQRHDVAAQQLGLDDGELGERPHRSPDELAGAPSAAGRRSVRAR